MLALTIGVACGSPAAPTPVPTPTNPRLSRSRFLAFGDSTTAGEVTAPVMGSSPPGFAVRQVVVPDASYPTVLALQLASRYTAQSQSLVITNAGRSGEPVVDALPRFIESFERERPEVVLLLDGYNDLLGRGLAVVDGASAAIGAIAVEARTRGARVFLATVTPNRPDRQRTIPTAVLLAYNDRLRSIATAERLVLVDLYGALLPAVDVNIGIDGLHPTEIGYRRIAEAFFTAVVNDLEVK